MPSSKNSKLLLAVLLALFICYLLAIFAFSSQFLVRFYALAVFLFALLCGYILGSLRRDSQVWQLVNDLKQQAQTKEIAQDKLLQADIRLKRQNEALATLTSRQLAEWKKPEEVFQEISEVAANTLEVERVSFWLLSEDEQVMHCADMYQRSTRQHTAGHILSAKNSPQYFLRTCCAAGDCSR